ncbi:type VI secretion system tube protein TssD [Rapidithrix thailandica]|uniref:Type VI secretion system tube protein TssD n=1 Tax=Rapidithrix thailandica TaxID=413964 RepID=A0AAW9SIU0_9BACT
MSLIAKMYVEDKEVTILDFKFRFTRSVDEHGKPMGKPNGTIFDITFETTSDQSFFAWSVGMDMVKKVKIVVSPVTQDSKSRVFELYDVHCVFFKNHFNGVNGEPMMTQIKLSPAILYDGGYKILEHYWKETDLSVKTEPTPLTDPYDNLTAGAGNVLGPVVEDSEAEKKEEEGTTQNKWRGKGHLIIGYDTELKRNFDKAVDNVNWDFILANTLEEAVEKTKAYLTETGLSKLTTLVLRSHGSGASALAVVTFGYPNASLSGGARLLNSDAVEKMKKDVLTHSGRLMAVLSIQDLAKMVKTGGTIFFTGCGGGTFNPRGGGSLGQSLTSLPEFKGKTVWMNHDNSAKAYHQKLLETNLTKPSSLNKGFMKFIDGKPYVPKYSVGFLLKSTGPRPFVYLDATKIPNNVIRHNR